jgi:hypothetical protein
LREITEVDKAWNKTKQNKTKQNKTNKKSEEQTRKNDAIATSTYTLYFVRKSNAAQYCWAAASDEKKVLEWTYGRKPDKNLNVSPNMYIHGSAEEAGWAFNIANKHKTSQLNGLARLTWVPRTFFLIALNVYANVNNIDFCWCTHARESGLPSPTPYLEVIHRLLLCTAALTPFLF